MNVACIARPYPPVSAIRQIRRSAKELRLAEKFRANGLLQNWNHPVPPVAYSDASEGLVRPLGPQPQGGLVAGTPRPSGRPHPELGALAALHRPQDRGRQGALLSMNALKHGFRSRATIREYQKIRYVLRFAARNIAILRAHIRARDQAARPQIKFKPWYARAVGVREARTCPA